MIVEILLGSLAFFTGWWAHKKKLERVQHEKHTRNFQVRFCDDFYNSNILYSYDIQRQNIQETQSNREQVIESLQTHIVEMCRDIHMIKEFQVRGIGMIQLYDCDRKESLFEININAHNQLYRDNDNAQISVNNTTFLLPCENFVKDVELYFPNEEPK